MFIYFFTVIVILSLLTLATSREKGLLMVAGIGSITTAVGTAIMGAPAIIDTPHTYDHVWYIDPFAGLLLAIIGLVQFTAYLASIPYFKHELKEKLITLKQAKLYYCFAQLFVLAMMIAVAANNIGLMWVALEATTLTTTMLVGLYAKKESLEAAWKYIVICSVGITLGLLGVFLVYYAAITSGVEGGMDGISWTTLHDVAKGFSPDVMKLAFIFILLGFGTKMGLVPMHTWLPDAHSKAPSPLSAMLSGLLLNVALLAILRYKALVDVTLGGPEWSNTLFIIFGAATFIVPTFFIIVQKNYKRMLAYSSIEHMGFIAFSIGLGPVGVAAAIIHMTGHALTKSMLFFGAGNLLTRWKSTKFDDVRDVMKFAPYTAVLFFIGILSILGLPPSPLFVSEYMAVGTAIGAHPYVITAILVAGVIIFAGMISKTATMIFQKKNDGEISEQAGEKWNMAHSAMLIHVVLLIVIGLSVFSKEAITVLEKMVTYLI